MRHQSIDIRTDGSQLVEPPDQVEDECLITKLQFYRSSSLLKTLGTILIILTGGIAYLVSRWFLSIRMKLLYLRTKIKTAELVLVTSKDGNCQPVQLSKKTLKINGVVDELLTFDYRLYRYYFDRQQGRFKSIKFSLIGKTCNQVHHECGRGLASEEERNQLTETFGLNSTAIPKTPLLNVFLDEVMSPFFLFQIFSCTLWFCSDYVLYSAIIVIFTLLSLAMTLWDSYTNTLNLYKMSYFQIPISVYRNLPRSFANPFLSSIMEYRQQISSFELVPGDIVEIPEDQPLPADLILLNGSCIMNEAMLTGESTPIVKVSLPYHDLPFNPLEEAKACMLLAGTKCIETRYYLKGTVPVLGLVYQTGFNTMKGQLIRSILFPKGSPFDFYLDSLKFIVSVGLVALVGLAWTIYSYARMNSSMMDILLACLDMVTIVIPPALPTCMSIGIAFSISRLRKLNIFCISPNKINQAGKVGIMCFDKTGTLTEDGLDMYGTVGINIVDKMPEFSDLMQIPELAKRERDSRTMGYLMETLACCHSLTKVQGKLIGDSLDFKMFEATNWDFEEMNQGYDGLVLAIVSPPEKSEVLSALPNKFEDLKSSLLQSSLLKSALMRSGKLKNESILPKKLGIIKRYEFSSKLQRMSVIVKELKADKFRLYVKGSPEKLRELCKPVSIPDSFHETLDHYAKKGFRILACGTKTLNISLHGIEKLERDDLENELVFLGFIIMENRIKAATASSIAKLHHAEIRTVMVTGDNILTAISVAKQCGMIPSDHRVFYGEVDRKTSGKTIYWRDFHNRGNKLTFQGNDTISSMIKKQGGQKNSPKEMDATFTSIEIDMEIKGKSPKTLEKYPEVYNMSPGPKKANLKKRFSIVDTMAAPWHQDGNLNFTLALSGEVFSSLLREKEEKKGTEITLFDKILPKAQIFARMKPNEKTSLVQELQKLKKGVFVGMCGDGANDCGALKASDVGISLSEIEASIAAPFTSKIPDISCVLEIFKEGRCSLTTSLQCFKFMALYSMVQFSTVCLLHGVYSDLSNAEYMWIDLGIILPLAALMGYTEAYEKLSKYKPISRLISFPVLASVLGQILIQICTQVGVYLVTISRYQNCVELHANEANPNYCQCYENTNVFLVANFQYLAVVMAFSIGPPFRKAFYHNYGFTFSLIVLYICCFVLSFYPWKGLRSSIPLEHLDEKMKSDLALIVVLNFLITFLYEKLLVEYMAKLWYKYK